MVTPARTRPGTREERSVATADKTDSPWVTIVWDDPVNLMSYVTYVFQKLFGYSRDEATTLMLDVHHKGRAVVTSGSRDKVEIDVAKLHGAGLWATMARDT
jgi:ATP-dependent Clp protease adaptor protein ClpS